jgi:hypothetical protein
MAEGMPAMKRGDREDLKGEEEFRDLETKDVYPPKTSLRVTPRHVVRITRARKGKRILSPSPTAWNLLLSANFNTVG